jgi:hypothetical protein
MPVCLTIKRALIFLLAIGPSTGSLQAGAPATTQAADATAQMESWWDDLQKPEPWASRALLEFSARPADSVAFIKAHLKPLKIEPTHLDELLAALGSDDEKVWKPAFQELSYLDPRLNKDLPTLMSQADNPIKRNHLVEVLCDAEPDHWKGHSIVLQPIRVGPNSYDFLDTTQRRMWTAEDKVSRLDTTAENLKKQWQRADRAIVLLQHIGTPEAISVLKDLATGNADARPTKIAKVALDSLEQSGK